MKRGVSLYLDLVRFAAAMTVFLTHASGRSFTGGLFWQIGSYSQAAVMVFFVISGYVIAYVLNEKEGTPREYVNARLARLYSVVIPALCLTAVSDNIGLSLNPAFYYDGPWGYPTDSPIPRYIATFFLTNQFWIWGKSMEPGINVPFWSLSFEIAYYAVGASIYFVRGPWRFVLCAAVALVAGPVIIVLSLNWFLGYAAYYVVRRIQMGRIAGWFLSLAGLLLLICAPLLRENVSVTFMGRNILADYYEGICFALHLVGIHFISVDLEVMLSRGERLFRWLGSLTFALYLFHRPLVQVLGVLSVGSPASWQQRIYLIGVTLLVVATIGHWCEIQKSTLRRALSRLERIGQS